MQSVKPDIIYEDAHILVCRKSAGLAVQTKKTAQKDMESILKNYLKTPELYVIHRLDQPVEGLVLFAKTKAAAAGAGRQDRMEKWYYAVVLPENAPPDGAAKNGAAQEEEKNSDGGRILTDYLRKDKLTNTSRVVREGEPDAKRAELVYRIIKTGEAEDGGPAPALARILLKTGRHHQIRIQMAHAGMPLLGDRKYGSERSKAVSLEKKTDNVALCAYRLCFPHPVTGKKMDFSILPEGRAFQPFLPVNPLEKNK